MDVIRREADPHKRKALWDEVNPALLRVRAGHSLRRHLRPARDEASLKGFNEGMAFPRFSNVWLEE